MGHPLFPESEFFHSKRARQPRHRLETVHANGECVALLTAAEVQSKAAAQRCARRWSKRRVR
jgi:hypothetical protein